MVTDRFIYIVYGSMNVYKKKSEVAAALSDYCTYVCTLWKSKIMRGLFWIETIKSIEKSINKDKLPEWILLIGTICR